MAEKREDVKAIDAKVGSRYFTQRGAQVEIIGMKPNPDGTINARTIPKGDPIPIPGEYVLYHMVPASDTDMNREPQNTSTEVPGASASEQVTQAPPAAPLASAPLVVVPSAAPAADVVSATVPPVPDAPPATKAALAKAKKQNKGKVKKPKDPEMQAYDEQIARLRAEKRDKLAQKKAESAQKRPAKKPVLTGVKCIDRDPALAAKINQGMSLVEFSAVLKERGGKVFTQIYRSSMRGSCSFQVVSGILQVIAKN